MVAPGEDCRRAVPAALDLGYRHIDTAQLYGNESDIGDALDAAGADRSEIFVTTKVWNDKRAVDEGVRSVEDSLRRLRTDYVDLLLIYRPVAFSRIDETLAGLLQAQERFEDETLRQIGQGYGKTPAQVALRWLLDQDVLVVPKATGAEHLASNLDVFDFTLSADDRRRIDDLARGERHVDPSFAPDWDNT